MVAAEVAALMRTMETAALVAQAVVVVLQPQV
jgi:hypothetical protein